jgi:hypothetical protein
MAEQAGGRPEVPGQLLDELSDVGATGEDYPVLERTPLYIRESLTFPYTEGMRFQDAVYRRLGAPAFDVIFRNPPLSTQEILHPDRYDDAVGPTRPGLPKQRNVRLLAKGDVGEFDYSAILRQFAKDADDQEDARRVASQWRGGAYRLYEDKKSKAPLLMHISEWRSPEAARNFFDSYLRTLGRKWTRMDIRQHTGTEVTGSGDRGDFLLRISGASVLSIEGITVK